MSNIFSLKGHSGCRLELSGNVIRKTSRDIEYNSRLSRQMEKQKAFKNTSSIYSPEINDSGHDSDGLFFFEMEFINGISGSEFLLRCDSDQFFWFVDCLERQLNRSTGTEEIQISEQVLEKASSLDGFPISLLEKVDWQVSSGKCHGDMTLENMIVFEDKIFLIDFLDSFVEVPSIDQSKILQDAYFGWSFREKGEIPYQKLLHIKRRFSNPLHDTLLLLHLFRILPYADSNTEKLVRKWIEILISRL